MTADPVAEALRECEEACPCRSARLYAECDISFEPDGYGVRGARFCSCSWWTEHKDPPKPEYRIQNCKHSFHAAIARYGEACREAGRESVIVREVGVSADAILSARIAAARLAGRLEVAEQVFKIAEDSPDIGDAIESLGKLYDRLRRGAGTVGGLGTDCRCACHDSKRWCTGCHERHE